MVFNSAVFFLFLICVLFLYWNFFNKSIKARNIFIIAASLFFYGWWDWRFVCLWIFTALTDFFVARQIDKTPEKGKVFLFISIFVNLSVLGFFKYYNFFVSSFAEILQYFNLHASVSTLQLVLPVGISFYTFQAMSYTIDVYRRKISAERNMFTYLAFISFFPQLVAGPIERAQHMLPQYNTRKVFDYTFFKTGLAYILWGLFKKVVVADNLALFVDEVFDHNVNYSGTTNMLAALFFTIQIYCDFSGYSDIAIGAARLLGFDLSQNFNHPYFASGFQSFWTRWHISLSSWFRDYLYISMGGNRKGKVREYFNIMLTFLLSGLWHGANVTFIIWGGLHGLFVSIEKILKNRLKIPVFLKGIFTFLCVSFAWIFFRSHTFYDCRLFIQNIFSFHSGFSIYKDLQYVYSQVSYGTFFILPLLLFILIELMMYLKEKSPETFMDNNIFTRYVFYNALIVGIFLFGVFNNAPSFIYFQF